MKYLKEVIVLGFSLLITNYYALSQDKLVEGVYTISNREYRVIGPLKDRFFMFYPRGESMPSPNPLVIGSMDTKLYIDQLSFPTKDSWFELVKNCLSEAKINQLKANKEWMRFICYIRNDGSVISGYFGVSNNSIFTVEELAKIYNHLKLYYKPYIKSKDLGYLQLNVISLTNNRFYF